MKKPSSITYLLGKLVSPVGQPSLMAKLIGNMLVNFDMGPMLSVCMCMCVCVCVIECVYVLVCVCEYVATAVIYISM